jgi:Mrp family chromosome partitioning ATPase
MLQNPSLQQDAAAGIASPPQTVTPDEHVAQVLESFMRPALFRETSRLLGAAVSPDSVAHAISVAPRGINGVVGLTARGINPPLVARLANAAVDAEIVLEDRLVRSVYAQAADAQAAELQAGRHAGLDQVSVAATQQNILGLRTLATSATPVVGVTAATPPRSPTTPRPIRDGAVAALLGLVLGGLLLITRQQVAAFSAASRVAGSTPDPRVVGRIPRRLLGIVVTPDGPQANVADREPFRIVRANLDFLRPEPPIRSVAVCGLSPGRATTTVAASLALACAASGRRTLLVDWDLHGGDLDERLGVDPGPGLAEVLLGRATIEDVTCDLTWAPSDGRAQSARMLCFVAAGNARREAIDGSPEALARLLRRWQDSYHLVVLDTSPVLATAESLAACATTDAVLLCLGVGLDRLADVARVERTVGRLGGGPIGHVLTGADHA